MNRKTNSFVFFLFLLAQPGLAQVSTYKQDIRQYRSQNWHALIADPRTTLKSQDSIFLDYYTVKERNKVYCQIEKLQGQTPFEMPTYSGQVKNFIKYAKLSFTFRHQAVQLYVYQNVAPRITGNNPSYVFLPFKDLTNGAGTYAGGRYLDIKTELLNGDTMILDLNKIYNPWCAYSDGYNCPIPPSENHLKKKINAGEKKFRKPH